MRRLLLLFFVGVAGTAFAANPQDEQVVRTAYAKLAYAVQSRTVYTEVQKNPNLTLVKLNKKLQENELRFEITDMSSGNLPEISERSYTDFVSPPDRQDELAIVFDTETFDESGKRASSYFAAPRWSPSSDDAGGSWDVPVKNALSSKEAFSRYVTATITVRFQGRSRTYRALWLFGDGIRAIDLVTGNSILSRFAVESAFPSVLTDTSLRSIPLVDEWLNSSQRFEASCKAGKQDVCCDSELHCGVSSADLQSKKPAPNTTATPKGGL